MDGKIQQYTGERDREYQTADVEQQLLIVSRIISQKSPDRAQRKAAKKSLFGLQVFQIIID